MPRRRVLRYMIGSRSSRVPPHHYDVPRASIIAPTFSTLQGTKNWIALAATVIADHRLVAPGTYNTLTDDTFAAGRDTAFGAAHLLGYLDTQLKRNKVSNGGALDYDDRLSEMSGWGEAAPDTLTEADPLDLVTTLQNLNAGVVIVDQDAADDANAASTDGCVRIDRDSSTGTGAGAITTLGGTDKTTLGLFVSNTQYRYRFWNTLIDLNERSGGGRRFLIGRDCFMLVRNSVAKHVVNVENKLGASAANQAGTIVVRGYPGETPELWCGNSTDNEVTPTQCPNPDLDPNNNTSTIFLVTWTPTIYRNDFHWRNIHFRGKRETAGGDWVFADRILQHNTGDASTPLSSCRFCLFTDMQPIRALDAASATHPDLVDLPHPVRSDSIFQAVYVNTPDFVFDSNYIEPVALPGAVGARSLATWPSDGATSVERDHIGNAALDFIGGVSPRITRNRFVGLQCGAMLRISSCSGTPYVAHNIFGNADSECIAVFDSAGTVVEYNRVRRWSDENLSPTAQGGAITFGNMRDPTCRYNVVANMEPQHDLSYGILYYTSGTEVPTPNPHDLSGARIHHNLLYRTRLLIDFNNPLGTLTDSEFYANLHIGMDENSKSLERRNAPFNFYGDFNVATLEGNLIYQNNFWRFADGTPGQSTIETGPHLVIRTGTTTADGYLASDTLTGFTENTALIPGFASVTEAENNGDFRFASDSAFVNHFPANMPLSEALSQAWEPD